MSVMGKRQRPARVPRVTAGGMLREMTPVEDYSEEYGLFVKREDKACLPPGPPFSKARGVYAHVKACSAPLIGVLDTRHSQGGWAVARACQILGKKCRVYYPEFKGEPGPREPQLRAAALGAELVGLKAGMSAVLWYQMRRDIWERDGYAFPNALKVAESVTETAREVPTGLYDWVIIPISSGTIAAGVIRGFCKNRFAGHPGFILHLGYSRSHEEVRAYVREASGVLGADLHLVDEGYKYKDAARPGETPPWPCNVHYDLKAFRWWTANREHYPGKVLFWNIG